MPQPGTISKRLQRVGWFAVAALATGVPLAHADGGHRTGPAAIDRPLADRRCEALASGMTSSERDFRLLLDFCQRLEIRPQGYVAYPGYGYPVDPVLEYGRPAASSGQDYFVKCAVGTDPEWIEFRLVTRSQCEAAQGTPRQ